MKKELSWLLTKIPRSRTYEVDFQNCTCNHELNFILYLLLGVVMERGVVKDAAQLVRSNVCFVLLHSHGLVGDHLLVCMVLGQELLVTSQGISTPLA